MCLRPATVLMLLICLPIAAPQTAEAQRRSRRTATPKEFVPAPNPYQSRHFKVITDLHPDEAKELMQRLETMISLVSKYFGRPLNRTIDMYVVDDLAHWPPESLAKLAPEGVASVQSGGGLTLSQTLNRGTRIIGSRAVVYAVADRGTPQHEAVHAYCALMFGRTGPVWYSEGMAEVGQYFRAGDESVQLHDVVLEYLKSNPPKELNEIVNNPFEVTGDSWQNYAWRWALCHLLGFNENYTDRFKPLGLALLAGKDVDFWQVYGSQAQEINFEYQLFLKDLEQGYRCDLCSWDWKARFRPPRGGSPFLVKVKADAGWQASRMQVLAGTEYEFAAEGEWQLDAENDPVSADGTEAGTGRLTAVIFNDYTLSEPIPLGVYGTFTAPTDGTLFLRCQDGWGQIADNDGLISVKLKPKNTGRPLPDPRQE